LEHIWSTLALDLNIPGGAGRAFRVKEVKEENKQREKNNKIISFFSQPLTALSMFAASCLNLLEMCWACLCIISVMISKNFELVVAHWPIPTLISVLKFHRDFNLAFGLILYLISNMNVFSI